MNSMFTRLLIWFAGMLALTFAGFWATTMYLNSRGPVERFRRSTANMHMDLAVEAYETGGVERLRKLLGQIDRHFPGEHHLLNAEGLDLAAGQSRPDLIREPDRAEGNRWRLLPDPPPPYIRRDSPDKRYVYVAIPAQFARVDLWGLLPYYGWIVALIALLCYALAITLVRPIRKLREALVRFGAGDLDSRARLTQRGEIGDLSRAFDEMAGRIQTLMTAERRLLQDISHELRSPLARLGFAIELAKSSGSPDAALDRIRRESRKLSGLVSELIQMTRAEGDPAERVNEQIALEDALEHVAEDCAFEAEAKRCILTRVSAPGLTVRGDQVLLERAIENILRNAIRHTPEESEVVIQTERQGAFALISIRDQGPGVPKEMLEDIFRPFFRVEADRNRSSGGVGLGLAIAQRSVHLHGGELWAENVAPTGLRVFMRLPLAPHPALAPGDEKTAAAHLQNLN